MNLDVLEQELVSPASPQVVALGIGWDQNSSWMRGSAAGPAAVEPFIFHDGYNSSCELGIDLGPDQLRWLGELELGEDPFGTIFSAAVLCATYNPIPLFVGGDHAITYPVVKGLMAGRGPRGPSRFSILHIDAHPDLYDELGGNRLSHASPFARIMEEGLVDRLVQVGIRTMTKHQREQAERFGVEVVHMKDFAPDKIPAFDGQVYMSIDLDGMDPAFAPGVAHAEPGGLTSRDVINMVHGLRGQIIGADIVEYNPARDLNDMTAVLVAKLVRELAGSVIADSVTAKL